MMILDIRFTLSPSPGPWGPVFFAPVGAPLPQDSIPGPVLEYRPGKVEKGFDMAAAINAAAGDGDYAPAALDLEVIESRVERSLVRKVRRLTDDFPERAIEVIRVWLADR